MRTCTQTEISIREGWFIISAIRVRGFKRENDFKYAIYEFKYAIFNEETFIEIFVSSLDRTEGAEIPRLLSLNITILLWTFHAPFHAEREFFISLRKYTRHPRSFLYTLESLNPL